MFQLYKNSVLLSDEIPDLFLELSASIKNRDSIIMFIFLTCNRSDSNPVKDFKEYERVLRAKHIAFKDRDFRFEKTYTKKEVLQINNTIKAYKTYIYNSIQNDIDLYDKKIFQFIDLLNNTTPEIIKNTHEITGRITFSTNIDIINTILDNSITIILDKIALKELMSTGKYNSPLRSSLSERNRNKLPTID